MTCVSIRGQDASRRFNMADPNSHRNLIPEISPAYLVLWLVRLCTKRRTDPLPEGRASFQTTTGLGLSPFLCKACFSHKPQRIPFSALRGRMAFRPRAREALLPTWAALPTIPALLDRTRMVRSLLPFPKHLVIAIGLLGLSICGVEFGLHLHDACLLSTGSYSERNACAPSWTVHHLLKPDVRITTTDPDTGTQVSWRTNSLGLRGPEYEIPKPVGVYRIVCLGDDSTLAPETAYGRAILHPVARPSRNGQSGQDRGHQCGLSPIRPVAVAPLAQTLAVGAVARFGDLQFRYVRRRG